MDWKTPDWWHAIVLAFGTYRLVRLFGWDDFPLAKKGRAWIVGEHWVPSEDAAGDETVAMPGKTVMSEVSYVRPAYRRPTLAHLVHCPFCMGAWTSLGVYLCYLASARWTVYALFPWALSGAVGLISKNWDP